ncbi:hypothetical protein HTZ84_02535 [Haloterrigena sp. SYSU A558-1]|uniref:Uncharacterized protein n=1 Tax=Haloterrigena gelatinilytica TaxID=2741724 RepID=A0A8J8KCX5_9EURY|nr:hypothetical protein [Haloterrigena gelatinilytica]NUB92890.1 hypothetical protein [Haloterrigena gelatinilytica]NUC71198.1 hypothetical protein [Haloterrigena gelatinilytica]
MGDTDTTDAIREIDLVFEWRRLCHACGERKRFTRLICDDCRERYNV